MSRGVETPATVVYPITEGSAKFPLVVMAHGHGGGRQENNLTNMLMDVDSSRIYALENFNMINKKRVGIMGYSRGGRVAIHSASMNPVMWKAMGLLAPSAELYIVEGANHGYGFYSDEKHLALEVANTMVDFFIANF